MERFPELVQVVDSMIKTSTTRPATAIIHWDPKRQQLNLIGHEATKKFFDGQYVRNMLSRSVNEVGILVYDGALNIRSNAVEKPQKEDIISLRSQALRTHVADFTKKFMRLKHDGIKQGYWEREYFRPPFWPGDVPFISPNDRTKGRHLSVEDLKVIATHFYEWLDDGNWEKLSEQSVKRTAHQGDSATCSGENGDATDGQTSSGVKRVRTTSPKAMDDEALSGADISAVTTAAKEQTSQTDATDQWRPMINNMTVQLVPPINQQQQSTLCNYHAPGISPLVAQNSFADSSVNSREVNVNNFGSSSNDNSTYIDVVGMDTDVDDEVPGGTMVTTGGMPMIDSAMIQGENPSPHVAQTDQRPPGDDRVMHTLQPPNPHWFPWHTQNCHGQWTNCTNQLSLDGSNILPSNVVADPSAGNYLPSVIDRNGPLHMNVNSPYLLNDVCALDCPTPSPAPNVTSPENVPGTIEASDAVPTVSADKTEGGLTPPREPRTSGFSSEENSDGTDSEVDSSDDSYGPWDDRSVDRSDDCWDLSDSDPDHSDQIDPDTHAGDEPDIVGKRVNVKTLKRLVTPRITYKTSQITRLDLVATPGDGLDVAGGLRGVCVLGDHVVVFLWGIYKVRLFKRSGPDRYNRVNSLGGISSPPGYFNGPYGMCTGHHGRAYVSDYIRDYVEEIDIAEDGHLRGLRALTAGGRLKHPRDVCTAYNSGELLVTCDGGVHVIDVTTGDIISTLPTPTRWTGTPLCVAFRDGRIVVTHDRFPHLLVYTAPYTHGAVHTIQGLVAPMGVFIDNQQNILVADCQSKCIFRLDTDSSSVSRYDVPYRYGLPRYMAQDGEHLLITTTETILRADMTQFRTP